MNYEVREECHSKSEDPVAVPKRKRIFVRMKMSVVFLPGEILMTIRVKNERDERGEGKSLSG